METYKSEEIWEKALGLIRERVNEGTFRIWFESTVGLGFDNGAFVVGVGSDFAKDWIETRFQKQIGDALAEVLGDRVRCRLVVSDRALSSAEADEDPDQPAIPDPGLSARPGGEAGAEGDPGAGDYSHAGSSAASGTPAGAAAPVSSGGAPAASRHTPNGTLNDKYTFESFVIGASNRFAHAAALAAAESPGDAYNPLFIYGGVGLGKTHLLQAIGHYVTRHSPQLKVRFVTIETFTNDFINSLRDDSIEGFKKRYRTNDVLLIDDIQFLERKEQTQEEFFHTFNALHEAGKQIVISSDRHPKALQTLEDRLVSRFEFGLITDIQPPDLETRIAILRKKVLMDGIPLADPEVLTYIASRVPTNIRELEGCLTRVVAFASFSNRPINTGLAQEVLKDIPEVAGTRITIEMILNVVAGRMQVSVAEIKGDRRSRNVVRARHVAMYLARELTDASLPKIGERLGGRDHTTVIHGVNRVAELMKKDRQLYDLIQQLTAEIKSAH
ncbi:MAG: chromosomal replication initiator protein DnaA [Thermoleophilia bacterium]